MDWMKTLFSWLDHSKQNPQRLTLIDIAVVNHNSFIIVATTTSHSCITLVAVDSSTDLPLSTIAVVAVTTVDHISCHRSFVTTVLG